MMCKKAATGLLDFPNCYPSYFPPSFPGARTSTAPTTSMDASEAPDDTGLLPTEGMLPFPHARRTSS